MKNRINGVFLFTLLGLAIFSSCSKEDLPDYVGTWSSSKTEQAITYKDVITLDESNFNMSSLLSYGLDFVEVGGSKGSLTVSGNKLTANITSEASYDYTNVKLVWETVDKNKVFEYSVSGSTLTIKYDENGTYEAEEISTYTKE